MAFTKTAMHFRAVDAKKAALTPDVRPVAPTSIGWPSYPAIDRARPCECHGAIIHVTAAAVGVCWHHPRPEHLRLEPFHWCCRTCDSLTHYWDISSNRRESALGADAGCLVLSWNHSTSALCLLERHKYRHKPSRRCVAVIKSCPCASRRGTRHERDATHGEDHGPATPIAHTAHARDGTRGGVRGGLRISGRCRRVVVGGAFRFRAFRNGPKCCDRPKTKRASPQRGQ